MAAVDGPETAEDAEEGGFAAAVGADDEEMVARAHSEGKFANQHIAIWRDDGDVGELDVRTFGHGAAASEDGGVFFC